MNALLVIPFTRLRWHPTNFAAHQKWAIELRRSKPTRDDFLARQRRPIGPHASLADGVLDSGSGGAPECPVLYRAGGRTRTSNLGGEDPKGSRQKLSDGFLVILQSFGRGLRIAAIAYCALCKRPSADCGMPPAVGINAAEWGAARIIETPGRFDAENARYAQTMLDEGRRPSATRPSGARRSGATRFSCTKPSPVRRTAASVRASRQKPRCPSASRSMQTRCRTR